MLGQAWSRVRRGARTGLWIACLAVLPCAPLDAVGAARLDLHAPAFGARRLEPLFGSALRSPGDSVLLARAMERVAGRLEDEGHLDARLAAEWIGPGRGGEWTLRVAVEEGPRYRIASLDLDAATPEEAAALRQMIEIGPGVPASPPAVERALTRTIGSLADQGYPYAELAIQGFEWDSAGLHVRLSGSRGPQVTISDVRIEGLEATRPELARRVVGRVRGRPFQPAAAEAARQRLVQLGLFRSVTYQGLEGEADWERGHLVYRVEESRYSRFEAALGRQNDGRLSGLASLELGNLAGTGRLLAGRWESPGRDRELFAARFVEPWLAGLPLRAELRLDHQREDTLYTRERAGVRFHFLLSGRQRLEGGIDFEHVLQPHAEAQDARLQSTVFAVEHDGRNDPWTPRTGSRARLSAGTSFKREIVQGGEYRKSMTSAVEGVVEWHRPLAGGLGLAWELSGAGRFASQPVLAVYERYVLGGAATLRGYDEQQFRADRYGLSRLEGRWFPGGMAQHVAVFWDHAWMLSRLAEPGGTRLEELWRDGIGCGLRFVSPAGRIGVDYALEPGRPPAEGKLHLQLISSF